MASETAKNEGQIKQWVKAAETHFQLKNWKNAIRLYTQAIDELPTPELLLARGKAYHAEAEEQRTAKIRGDLSNKEQSGDSGSYANLCRYAFKDYTDAISLSSSAVIEKEARLQRMLLDLTSMHNGQDYDEWLSDVTWLKLHTKGREHGEILFWEQQVFYWRVSNEGLDQESVLALTQAMELGYSEPEVYFLRGQANTATFNFGLALQDFDAAIARTESKNKRMVEYLISRTATLVEMKRYAEARETLLQAKKLDQSEMQACMWDTRELYDHCLIRWALQTEFNNRAESEEDEVERTINRILVLSRGYTWLRLRDTSYPDLMSTVRKMLGKNLWPMLEKRLDAFMVDIQAGSVQERTILRRTSIEIVNL
jgi:tetratricopeptide (TPR) repeat protein